VGGAAGPISAKRILCDEEGTTKKFFENLVKTDVTVISGDELATT
jgi:hypothetical protein